MHFKLRAVIANENVCVQDAVPTGRQSQAVGALLWRTRVHGKTRTKFFAISTKKKLSYITFEYSKMVYNMFLLVLCYYFAINRRFIFALGWRLLFRFWL